MSFGIKGKREAKGSSISSVFRAVVFAGSALAAASFANAAPVSFNTVGDGFAGAAAINAPVNVQGSGFVLVRPDQATGQLLFSEAGAYRLTGSDDISPIGPHDISLVYSVSGLIDLSTGRLSFSDGGFSLYSDANFNFGTASNDPAIIFGANDGEQIASFRINGGAGVPGGSVHMEGQSLPGSIRPGYFFSATGDDLSLGNSFQFAIDIGNVTDPSPSATVVSEIICKAMPYPVPGCDGTEFANSPYFFLVKDGGQATLSTADGLGGTVPEPGSAALALFGLVGVGFGRKRTRRQ